MKQISLLVLLLTSSLFFAQVELKFDEQKSLFTYSSDVKTSITEQDLVFKLKTLGFTDISNERNHVFCKGYFSKIIMMTSLQVHYSIIIRYENNNVNFYISNFVIDDKRFSPVPLENIKSGKKRWISEINEKLPSIIKSIFE